MKILPTEYVKDVILLARIALVVGILIAESVINRISYKITIHVQLLVHVLLLVNLLNTMSREYVFQNVLLVHTNIPKAMANQLAMR